VPAAPITNGDTVPLAQYQKLYADACESAMQHDHANAQVKASAARAEKAEKERDSFQRANAANVDIVMKLNAEVDRLASALAASERRKDGRGASQ
jgi:predicted cobalt transporter CbtA